MKIIIQGYKGSFHDEVTHRYFKGETLDIVPAESFQVLASRFKNESDIDFAVMAIENNIAGSILQNYRLIRENGFVIIGETYLQIKMNLMVLPGVKISDLTEIHSHPMALYQCTKFLNQYPHIKLVEHDDTALSAADISNTQNTKMGAIASERAAGIYGLDIISDGIEDEKNNYTRFFILSKNKREVKNPDKASIWCRIGHEKGSLLNLLQIVYDYNINISKLQSFPVASVYSEYSFHIDLVYNELESYLELKEVLIRSTKQFLELGVYVKKNRV